MTDLDGLVDAMLAMRRVLGQLEMLSHGSITPYNSSGVQDAPDSRGLSMHGETVPHLYWRARFERATSPAQRETCIRGGQKELDSWRGRGEKGTETNSVSDIDLLRQRILVEGRGWSAQDVSRSLRCTATFVRKTRINASVDADGNPTVLSEVLGYERVRELAAKGLSERQIGLLTSVPKTTIRRVLGRAA